MKFFFSFFLFFASLYSFNFEITNSSISNGATSLIKFTKEKNVKYESIKIGKKNYKIYEHPLDKTQLYALISISYYSKAKDIMADIYYIEGKTKKQKSVSLRIQDGKYKKEEIQVTKSKVNPKGDKANKRINKEYHEAMNIYATSTKKNYLTSPFILPLNSFITSDFGKARVYNGTLKGYHSGTDFRAKIGTPIIASNDGVVVLVKNRFYSGGTVIINHGRGVYTCYYHMSRLDSKLGQKVKKNEVIGLSGQTGRVTGPHLHFSVRVNGIQVDPLGFVTLMNENILNKKDTN